MNLKVSDGLGRCTAHTPLAAPEDSRTALEAKTSALEEKVAALAATFAALEAKLTTPA